MNEKQEFHLRQRAIRLWLRGVKSKNILEKVQRSRCWLSKWQKRFNQQGTAGLHSHSRRPQHSPTIYAPRIVRLILQTRQRLVKRKIGLIGLRAIRRELSKLGLGKQLPAPSTIRRILQADGSFEVPPQPQAAYFPKPLATVEGILHAMDWTCRYLEDGPKVYAFHTLNLRNRACTQTIAADKSAVTAMNHCKKTWKTMGIPHFLQLDNDSAFCGGHNALRIFGQFVRLNLYVGVELIFLPIAEPECNGEVEELNGLWGHAFWERQRFASFGQVSRASPKFIQWYMTDYTPPYLAGLTPQQAQRTELKHRLTATQMNHLPDPLPITAGRVHFIRKVKPDGAIVILNETWKVSKRLAGRYVWVTITTHRRLLRIWYQRSAHREWRLLKSCAYDISETVARLKPEFARFHID